MPHRFDPKRLTVMSRSRALVVASLASGVLVAGCGGSSTTSTTATVTVGDAGTTASTVASSASAAAAKSSASGPPGALAFAECMRANGVPNFPDPQPGRGLEFSVSGVNLAAPAVRAAQAKCRKLLPGGPPGPGTQTHPSAQTLARLLRIARCMRQHGISQFPDPRTSVPSDFGPTKYEDLTDFDGVILLFPVNFNLQSPAYRQALTACGAPPLGLPH